MTASLVFCVGPLTILGSLDDGLGRGIDKLALKATLDGFASIAFAASLGWGVAASALVVLVVQGSLTLLGAAVGRPAARRRTWPRVTATGGLLLVGVGAAAAPDPPGPGGRPAAGPGRRAAAGGRGHHAAVTNAWVPALGPRRGHYAPGDR